MSHLELDMSHPSRQSSHEELTMMDLIECDGYQDIIADSARGHTGTGRRVIPPNCVRYGSAVTCTYCSSVVSTRIQSSLAADGTLVTVEEGARGYECSRGCDSWFCSSACVKDGWCRCMWERAVHRASEKRSALDTQLDS